MAISNREQPGMPPELLELMKRFNALGQLLPRRDDWDDLDTDSNLRAEVEVVIAEMKAVKLRIDQFLIQHGLKPWFGSATASSRS